MKIGIIGSLGHLHYVEQVKEQHEFTAIASGGGEDISYPLTAFSGAKLYDSPDELIEKADIDLLVVNTYADINYRFTANALRRGIHVFAEKPLAISLEQLAEIESAYSEGKAQLGCMLALRGEGHFAAAKKAVEDGLIGEVRLISAQKSYKMGTRPDYYRQNKLFGGLIPWVMIHAIDYICYTTGLRCESVTSGASNIGNLGMDEMERSSAALFKMENDVYATITADYLRPAKAPTHEDDRLRIAGTQGVVEVRDGKAICICADGVIELEKTATENIMQSFTDSIEKGTKSLCTAQDAIYATKIAILAGMKNTDTKIN